MLAIGAPLHAEHFIEMAQLERRFYGDEYITPAAEAFACYTRFPLSTVAATAADGGVVGFVNLFPVRQHVFNGLLSGTFNDSALTEADMAEVPPPHGERLPMFLSCIAIDPAYRAGGTARRLLCAAADGYASVEHLCDLVVTDNVTEDGRRFSERLGFSFVCESDHGSRVYAMRYAELLQRLRRAR